MISPINTAVKGFNEFKLTAGENTEVDWDK